MSASAQAPVLLAAACMLASLATQGFLHELLASSLRFTSPDVFALVVPLSAFVGGLLSTRAWRAMPPRAAPLRAHAAVGVTLWLAFRLTAIAPAYLSFPAFLAAKAARLLPTMGVGSLWLKKRYRALDWLAATVAAGGLALALASDSPVAAAAAGAPVAAPPPASEAAVAPSAGVSALGALLMFGALLFDGVSANAQEQLFTQYHVDRAEISIFAMGAASLLSLAWGLLVGQLREGVVRGLSDARIAAAIFAYAVASFACNISLLAMIQLAGASSTAFVGAVCRAGIIASSFVLFPKRVSGPQLVGMSLVFAGVGLSMSSLGSAPGGRAPAPHADAAAKGARSEAGAAPAAAPAIAAPVVTPEPSAVAEEVTLNQAANVATGAYVLERAISPGLSEWESGLDDQTESGFSGGSGEDSSALGAAEGLRRRRGKSEGPRVGRGGGGRGGLARPVVSPPHETPSQSPVLIPRLRTPVLSPLSLAAFRSSSPVADRLSDAVLGVMRPQTPQFEALSPLRRNAASQASLGGGDGVLPPSSPVAPRLLHRSLSAT